MATYSVGCLTNPGRRHVEFLLLRGMLNLMGFPQDATIIEEDNQACVYASEIPHMTRGMGHLDLAKGIKLLKVASADNTLRSFIPLASTFSLISNSAKSK